MPSDVPGSIDAVVAGVREGRFTQARVDSSVRRVLLMKQQLKLERNRFVDLDTVRAVVDSYPFERELDGHQSYVTFVADAAVLDELAALGEDAGPDEKIRRGEGVVYWQVPKGSTLDSSIGKTMGKPRYKSSTTTRNLRTLDKVLR